MKLTLPVARSTGGSCGYTVRLLLANWYSPATFVAARLVIGSSSLRLSLPLPSALIDSVKPPVMRLTGVASMNLRNSPVAPSAWPLMATSGARVTRFGILTRTFVSCAPSSVPRRPTISILSRSNSSSASMS